MNYLERRAKKDRIRSQNWTSIKPKAKPTKTRSATIVQDWLIVCLIYVALMGVIMMWTL